MSLPGRVQLRSVLPFSVGSFTRDFAIGTGEVPMPRPVFRPAALDATSTERRPAFRIAIARPFSGYGADRFGAG